MVVIHNGKIIEQGTHTELLANQGMYYELYHCPFAENKMTFFNFLPVVYKRQPINQVIPKYEFVK
jgi:hypothetical protein